ncbi:MAG TPA: hypothetical protein VG273_15150 [Bryobacteraceae bacterium]|jgi:quercetin dioxygenase-like cupin family protein|nr:hypothetical protein [Bryobacteraceae bacterium]
MTKIVAGGFAVLIAVVVSASGQNGAQPNGATILTPGYGDGAPPAYAFDITKADIDLLLKDHPGGDKQMRVVDMGKYNEGVGLIYRGPTNDKPGDPIHVLYHDFTPENYLIISGGGVLTTGGVIDQKTHSNGVPNVMNGPGGAGIAGRGAYSRKVSTGDIIIVPTGVAHGWSQITDHVTYLSFRPDPDRVLPAGWVYPTLLKNLPEQITIPQPQGPGRGRGGTQGQAPPAAGSIVSGGAPIPTPGQGAGAPPAYAFDITKAEIDMILKNDPGTDRQLRVVDMGKFNEGVGVIHRGPTNDKPGDPIRVLYHDYTPENYYILSGGGVLTTGGIIENRSGGRGGVPNVMNGPGGGGIAGRGAYSRRVSAGDIIIVPRGVAHGWSQVTDHVDYLSFRPDPDRVLPAGWVYPMLLKNLPEEVKTPQTQAPARGRGGAQGQPPPSAR